MKNKKLVGRILIIIASIVIIIIVAILSVIGLTAGKNLKAMNQCLDASLSKISDYYTLTKRDAGEYEKIKLYGILNFDADQYEIEELGNLSVMRVNMGFMQMATLVITPRDRNLPLLSADYMYIMGNRKAYLEFYDVVGQKDEQYQTLLTELSNQLAKYEELENITPSEAWYEHLLTVTAYKAGKADADAVLQEMLTDCLVTYLKQSQQFPLLEASARQEKLRITKEYTDGLIEKGGISTDVFKSALGEEETTRFFDNVFFGTLAE